LQAALPHITSRVSAKQFIGEFLDGDNGARTLDLENLERYLEWLKVQVSGSDEATLQLLIRDPLHPDDCVFKRFQSLSEAYRWMQDHKPTQAPDDEPEDRPSPFTVR
jgi:hypothetical protein